LQKLAGGPARQTGSRVKPAFPVKPAKVDRKRAWRPYEEAEGASLEEGLEPISDKEIVLTVLDEEQSVITDGFDAFKEDVFDEMGDTPETEQREDDPLLQDLPDEPWDSDWQIED
ncbi:MAG: hypothetical protein DRJ03_06985, partial [Chloroflexi bacterium]